MTKLTSAAVAACVALLLVCVGSPASAKTFTEKESTLTTSEPVEVPGAVLEPGTYVVKVIELQNNRNVVQVTNVDGTKIYTTCIATPHETGTADTTPPPNTVFVYYPNATASGAKVLRTWYAPNDRFGQDFIYPKSRAEELARLNKVEVRSYEIAEATPSQKQLETTTITTVPAEPIRTEPSIPSKIEEPVKTAEVAPAPAPEPEATVATKTTKRHAKMPRTASEFPLVFALGLLAASGAGALRLLSRSA